MLRTLKAFAWLRWRILLNSLEHTGSRDRLERFSIAIERLGPILAAILLIPSALGLFGIGIVAGYQLGNGDPQPMLMQAVRYILFAVPLLAIIGPLLLPAADRTNPIRFLLLPIPRSTLYVAQSSASFADPWTMLMIPLTVGIASGVAASGMVLPAVPILIAAALLIVVVVGLSALTTSVLHLVVRDRRRGELIALIFIMVLPVVSMLPGLLGEAIGHERGKPRSAIIPAWLTDGTSRALSAYPTEMFVRHTRAATSGDVGRAATALGGLFIAAALIHAAGFVTYRRVLDSPGSSGARRSAPMRAAWGWRLPGLSSGASAVATAQLRLALRTPRGRSIFLSPLAILAIFGILIYRGSGNMDFGSMSISGGISLATFAAFTGLLSILPIAMNQFAVDRAGLTMTLLSPLTDDEVLAGKAAGNALIAAPPVIISLVIVLLVFPTGPLWPWLTLVFSLVAIYLIAAPVAAMCSAIFPREVDMNSIGRGSNAHGAAGLLGLLAFAGAGVPPLLLALFATTVLDRPLLAPVFVLIWCGLAYVISRLLFIVARKTFASRRENLAML